MPDLFRSRRDGAFPKPALFPLKVQELSYDVGGICLLDRIEFRVERSRKTVIMGPNGAGKSILLRLLHGLLQPTHGQIRWGDISNPAQARNRQAMVFQRPVLLRQSVTANLLFFLRQRPFTTDERAERLAQILQLAALEGFADHPAWTLSGGERQRLSVARALLLDPEVLLLDEPTVSLDPHSIAAIEELVGVAGSRGIKIILVTHDIGQARRMADEVLFLHKGCITEQSPANEFFERPSSDPARSYLAGRIVPRYEKS